MVAGSSRNMSGSGEPRDPSRFGDKLRKLGPCRGLCCVVGSRRGLIDKGDPGKSIRPVSIGLIKVKVSSNND